MILGDLGEVKLNIFYVYGFGFRLEIKGEEDEFGLMVIVMFIRNDVFYFVYIGDFCVVSFFGL